MTVSNAVDDRIEALHRHAGDLLATYESRFVQTGAGVDVNVLGGVVRFVDVDDEALAMLLVYWDHKLGPRPAMLAGGSRVALADEATLDQACRLMDAMMPGRPLDITSGNVTLVMAKFGMLAPGVRGGEIFATLVLLAPVGAAIPREPVKELLQQVGDALKVEARFVTDLLQDIATFDGAASPWKALLVELRRSAIALWKHGARGVEPPPAVTSIDGDEPVPAAVAALQGVKAAELAGRDKKLAKVLAMAGAELESLSPKKLDGLLDTLQAAKLNTAPDDPGRVVIEATIDRVTRAIDGKEAAAEDAFLKGHLPRVLAKHAAAIGEIVARVDSYYSEVDAAKAIVDTCGIKAPVPVAAIVSHVAAMIRDGALGPAREPPKESPPAEVILDSPAPRVAGEVILDAAGAGTADHVATGPAPKDIRHEVIKAKLTLAGYAIKTAPGGQATAFKKVRVDQALPGVLAVSLSFTRAVLDAAPVHVTGAVVHGGDKDLPVDLHRPTVTDTLALHWPGVVDCRIGPVLAGRLHGGTVIYPVMVPVVFCHGRIDDGSGAPPRPFHWHVPPGDDAWGYFLVCQDDIDAFDRFLMTACAVAGKRILLAEHDHLARAHRIVSGTRSRGVPLVLAWTVLAGLVLLAGLHALPEGITVGILDLVLVLLPAIVALPLVLLASNKAGQNALAEACAKRRQDVLENPLHAAVTVDEAMHAARMLKREGFGQFVQAFESSLPVDVLDDVAAPFLDGPAKAANPALVACEILGSLQGPKVSTPPAGEQAPAPAAPSSLPVAPPAPAPGLPTVPVPPAAGGDEKSYVRATKLGA